MVELMPGKSLLGDVASMNLLRQREWTQNTKLKFEKIDK